MDLISHSGSVLNVNIKSAVQNKIVDEVRGWSSYMDLRLDQKLTLRICNIVEVELTLGKSKNVDKKQFVIDILNVIYTLTDDEQKIIGQQIDFIFDEEMVGEWTTLEIQAKKAFKKLKSSFFSS